MTWRLKTKEELPANFHGKFSDDEILSFIELGEVLLEIRREMIKDGYNIVDGKVVKIKKPDEE